MSIVLVGVSQRTAPVSLRERLSRALSPAACGGDSTFGGPLWTSSDFREFACLSTCNRLEVYTVCHGTNGHARGLIVSRMAESGGVAREELEPHIYHKEDADAVDHLLRVACGLDSQVLGETQILGQVSQAFAAARETGTSGPLLTYLFSRAAHAGKRARTETDISKGGTSISHAAVDLLEKELGDLAARSILVVGAGETAELTIQALYKHGASTVSCINRTFSSAEALALRSGCLARSWADLAVAMTHADAVVTATGAPHPVIYAEDVAPAIERRQGVPLTMVDIAVPRDIDLNVASLPGVVLHDIDQLEAARDQNLARRMAAVPEVEEIIARESEVVMEWLHGREAADLLAGLHQYAKAVAEAELAGALRRLGGIDENTEDVISRMANRIVNKLLHQPTKQLKARVPREDFEVYCDAVVDLFGLHQTRLPRAGELEREGGAE